MLAWATGVSHLPTADVSEGDNSAPDVVVKTDSHAWIEADGPTGNRDLGGRETARDR
jgi:hypothetical protein